MVHIAQLCSSLAVSQHSMGPGLDKSYVVFLFRLIPIALITLAKAAHINGKDAGGHILAAALFGQQGLFDCEHAADSGAIVSIFLYIPGTNTLQPGNGVNICTVRPKQCSLAGAR